MNLNICEYKCRERMMFPVSIIYTNDDEWYLGPSACQDGYLLIQKPCDFLENLPDGWEKRGHSYVYCKEDLKSFIKTMWQLHVDPRSGCPFCAEHLMAEIKHDERMDKWSKWNEEMKRKYAKADGEKLS